MDQFQLLIKPVSYDCNLRCKYCFYLRIGDEVYDEVSRPRMSEEILKSMISQYLSYRFSESIFGWQGGEPTLAGLNFFKKAVSLQQEYGESGQVVGNALQTNGILIDEEWAKFLHQYRFLVGLSLDGPKSIHNRYRRTRGGNSVWKKVMRAAELFQRYNVQFNILCVVSRANVNRIEEVYNFFLDHNFNHMQFIPALEIDEKGNKATFSINPNQYGKFLCRLFDLWKQNPNRTSIRFFDAVLSYYLGHPKGECTLEKGCAEYLLVEHNGDIYPCDFFVQEKYKLGNILRTSLSKLKQKRARSFEKRKHTLSEDCKTCNWLVLCYGGCVKDRIFEANPHPEKTYFCDAYKQFFDHAAHWFQAQADQIRSRHPRS